METNTTQETESAGYWVGDLNPSEESKLTELLEGLEKLAGQIVDSRADSKSLLIEDEHYDDDELKDRIRVAFLEHLEGVLEGLEDDECEKCGELREVCECDEGEIPPATQPEAPHPEVGDDVRILRRYLTRDQQEDEERTGSSNDETDDDGLTPGRVLRIDTRKNRYRVDVGDPNDDVKCSLKLIDGVPTLVELP